MIPSTNGPGDPIAVANQVLGMWQRQRRSPPIWKAQAPGAAGHLAAPPIPASTNAPAGSAQGRIPQFIRRQAQIRGPPRHVSDQGALFLGRRQCRRPEQGIDSRAGTVD